MFGHQNDDQQPNDWQHPGKPLEGTQLDHEQDSDHDADVVTPVVTPTTQPVASDDLVQLKQQALAQLSPLVSHLDQSPEEKFRTLMMMIQASDDQSLLKDAYAAAEAIPDEKSRAQAMLDVVNEINYFTQQQK